VRSIAAANAMRWPANLKWALLLLPLGFVSAGYAERAVHAKVPPKAADPVSTAMITCPKAISAIFRLRYRQFEFEVFLA
jgi:hypothetical protein